MAAIREVHQLNQFSSFLLALLREQALIEQRHLYILEQRQLRNQIEALKHKADVLAANLG